jgi:hypothetical protein
VGPPVAYSLNDNTPTARQEPAACGISIRPMTAVGQERRISAVRNISASLLKADVEPTFNHRGFVPIRDIQGSFGAQFT